MTPQSFVEKWRGVPWGAKDIMAVKGYKTTWGSGAYKDQIINEESSVVEMLRDAGAVLLAKLASGELASGDQWYEIVVVSCAVVNASGIAVGDLTRDEFHACRECL